jgi:imidazolonepropionase
MTPILIRGARQLITLRGPAGPRRGAALNQLSIIEDGAVLIEDGVIRQVGPSRRIENLGAARIAREISAAGRVVMPAFVDSHTHLISGPPRMEALEGNADAAFQAVRDLSARRLREDAELLLRGFLAHGTTTIEAKSGYGGDESGELKILRALGAIESPVDVVPTLLARPAPGGSSNSHYLHRIAESLLPEAHRRGLVRFVDALCDAAGFDAVTARDFLGAARRLGLPVKVHLSQRSRVASASVAVDLAALTADHLDFADESDIATLAPSTTVATFTPAATFFLGSERYAPARQTIDAGGAVALATGFSHIDCPTYNMQLAIFLAHRRMALTPAEAIAAATINGAHAVGLAHRIGSLEVGKQADIVVLAVSDYRELTHIFGVNQVQLTIKRGEVVYQNAGAL